METPRPVVLADVAASVAAAGERRGVLWRLAEGGRQLDANVVRLPAGASVAPHTEPDVDVLLLVVAGSGVVDDGEAGDAEPVATGSLVWLPHGARRSLRAGDDDALVYLTVHRARTGRLRIKLPDDPALRQLLEDREEADQGGESSCLLATLCPACDVPVNRRDLRFCPNCGVPLDGGSEPIPSAPS